MMQQHAPPALRDDDNSNNNRQLQLKQTLAASLAPSVESTAAAAAVANGAQARSTHKGGNSSSPSTGCDEAPLKASRRALIKRHLKGEKVASTAAEDNCSLRLSSGGTDEITFNDEGEQKTNGKNSPESKKERGIRKQTSKICEDVITSAGSKLTQSTFVGVGGPVRPSFVP